MPRPESQRAELGRRGRLASAPPAITAIALWLAIAGCGERELPRAQEPPTGREQAPWIEQLGHRLQRRRLADARAKAPSEARFSRFARRLDGEAGIAIGAPSGGGFDVFGGLATGPAWSTIKVPIALAVLRMAGGPSALDGEQAELIRRALTESDNDAAAALFASLGTEPAATDAVTEVLRAAGDARTTISTVGRDGFSPYGQTDWSLRQQHRFMAALARECPVDPRSSRYVLKLMGEVTSDEWGLGSAGVPGRWKGGWGPDPDGRYIVRQMGVLELGDRELVVALIARAGDGTFESAQRIANDLAAWATRHGEGAAGAAAECRSVHEPGPTAPRRG